MLTIFTVPKPFVGHIDMIQRNAIQSWLTLIPRCEVILLGDDLGIGDVAAEFQVKHFAAVDRNEYGTPLLNSVFEQVQKNAQYSTLCYVNGDIILTQSLISAVRAAKFARYLMVGQRRNIEVSSLLDFSDPIWADRLLSMPEDPQYADYMAGGSDYFVFPKGAIPTLPAFTVGRPGWDNWLIYYARELNMPVLDATRAVKCVHQSHDYAHIPQRQGKWWDGPEAKSNFALINENQLFTLRDATHVIAEDYQVRLALGEGYIRRRLEKAFNHLESRGLLSRPLQSLVFRGLRSVYRRMG